MRKILKTSVQTLVAPIALVTLILLGAMAVSQAAPANITTSCDVGLADAQIATQWDRLLDGLHGMDKDRDRVRVNGLDRAVSVDHPGAQKRMEPTTKSSFSSVSRRVMERRL